MRRPKGKLLLLDLAYPGRLGLVNDDFDGNKSSKKLVTLYLLYGTYTGIES